MSPARAVVLIAALALAAPLATAMSIADEESCSGLLTSVPTIACITLKAITLKDPCQFLTKEFYDECIPEEFKHCLNGPHGTIAIELLRELAKLVKVDVSNC